MCRNKAQYCNNGVLCEVRCVCVVSPQLASSSGILYFETSAESGENVQELFETLATEILDQVLQHFNILTHECMHATPLPSCSLTSSERFVQGLQTHRHTQTRTDSLTHTHTPCTETESRRVKECSS